MTNWAGRVAVITGGASGIGLSMARRFASEGMKLVLGDIEQATLEREVSALSAAGADVIGVPTDVRSSASVQALADRAYEKFGKVNVLCNNAGVQRAGAAWDMTEAEWDWVLDINLKGVVHGMRIFPPRMLESGEPGHIINTASFGGLASAPMMSAYSATKAAVISICECSAMDLNGTNVAISALCPAFIQTALHKAARNLPADVERELTDDQRQRRAMVEQVTESLVTGGRPTDDLVEQVMAALEDKRLYILTHPELLGVVKARAARVLEDGNR